MKSFWKVFFGALIGTLVAFLAVIILSVGMIGSLASLTGETKTVVPKSGILKIDFSTGIAEQSSETFSADLMSGNISLSGSMSLLDAIRAIDVAATDPAIKFIYLNTDNLQASTAACEELREALVNFRKAGKAIVSYNQSLTGGQYYLASVADKIVLNPYGECTFAGLSTQMIYYKDLLDKLDVDIQLIRHGKYKSAGEPFIRNDISDENRLQYETLLGSMWKAMASSMADSRDFSVEDLDEWINNLTITDAAKAKELGIVDELWFDDQMEDYLCNLYDVKDVSKLSFVTLSDYAKAKVTSNYKAKEKIAVIYANGEIAMGDNGEGVIGDNFARELAKARKDSTIKAVVFRVNSPGGAVQAAAIIEREMQLLKAEKPVIASYGEYAASGGYWISAGCDRIFSDNMTLTGSIGVFGIVPSLKKAINNKLHVNVVEVSTHKHGTILSPIEKLDPEEEAYIQNSIENVYTDFTSLVARGRGMTVEAVDEIGQGRVWTGADALGIGLVDEIGGLTAAIEYAADMAGLTDYNLVEYPVVKSTMERLMDAFQNVEAAVSSLEAPAIMARLPYNIISIR